MENNVRRKFIKSLASGIAATIALPTLAYSDNLKKDDKWLECGF